MNLKHASLILWISLVLGWCFDLLFWKHTPGISFPIFVILNLAAGLVLVHLEGHHIPWQSYLLIVPILFFAVMFAVRQESLTSLVNFSFSLGLMLLLAVSLRSGLWLQYSLSDMVVNSVKIGLGALSGGSTLLTRLKTVEESGTPADASRLSLKPWAVLRGLLLAFPLVFVLAMLLASADPVFSQMINQFFNLDQWAEYALRGVFILILAYLLAGVFLYTTSRSHESQLIGLEKPWLAPFLGWTEAVIVLAAVDLLFAAFVSIQFRYFFGGQANIQISGFTYAEYARRGFGELLAVAILSLMLLLGLSTITHRPQALARRIFSALGIGLVALVLVILASALQRLLLYESVYSFSRLRTYTHIFMIWLGILLLMTIGMEIVQRQRLFALMALLAALGFGVTLNLINVDAYIVQQNISQVRHQTELDAGYFTNLSDDAVPAMLNGFLNTSDPQIKDDLGAVLACRDVIRKMRNDDAWQAAHYAHLQARSLLDASAVQLAAYPTVQNESGVWQVKVQGVLQDCMP